MQLFRKEACQLSVLYLECHTSTFKVKSPKCQFLTNAFTVVCFPQVKFTCAAYCFLQIPSFLQLLIKNKEEVQNHHHL